MSPSPSFSVAPCLSASFSCCALLSRARKQRAQKTSSDAQSSNIGGAPRTRDPAGRALTKVDGDGIGERARQAEESKRRNECIPQKHSATKTAQLLLFVAARRTSTAPSSSRHRGKSTPRRAKATPTRNLEGMEKKSPTASQRRFFPPAGGKKKNRLIAAFPVSPRPCLPQSQGPGCQTGSP